MITVIRRLLLLYITVMAIMILYFIVTDYGRKLAQVRTNMKPARNVTVKISTTFPQSNNCTAETRTEECFYQTDRVTVPHNFQLNINNPTLCTSAKVHLLIMISSRVDDFDRRVTQRETWASIGSNSSKAVRVAFLLGTVSNESIEKRVTAESSKYNDILQETFDDTYLNLTLKTVMLFRWASTFCPQAQWIMKTDTDVFVNVPHLLEYLEKQDSTIGTKSEKTLIGRIANDARPHRFNESKWYTSEQFYPMDIFPPFAFGPCYVISGDLSGLLYEMSQKTPMLHSIEDVFTGLLIKKLGGKYLHHEGFCNFHIPNSACSYRNLFCGHDVSPDEMRKVWAEMNDKNFNCN